MADSLWGRAGDGQDMNVQLSRTGFGLIQVAFGHLPAEFTGERKTLDHGVSPLLTQTRVCQRGG